MNDDIAVDQAFRTFGLHWTASVEELFEAARAQHVSSTDYASPPRLAYQQAVRFAASMAMHEEALLDRHPGPFRWHHGVLMSKDEYLAYEGLPAEEDEVDLIDEGLLLDSEAPSPPEAWELEETRISAYDVSVFDAFAFFLKLASVAAVLWFARWYYLDVLVPLFAA